MRSDTTIEYRKKKIAEADRKIKERDKNIKNIEKWYELDAELMAKLEENDVQKRELLYHSCISKMV
jgi:hypothetical protein